MIDYVPETGSTNSDLAERLRAGEHLAEGYWLVADRQQSGRGRQGREWFDGSGNFMGSTVVHPAASDPAAPTLALLSGLALYETCLQFCPEPGALALKWPNDLLLGRAKLAGILLEGEGRSVIVGIGVNLTAAPQLPDRATVALSQFGSAPDRNTFTEKLHDQFATELERWRTYGLAPILRRWAQVAHPVGTAMHVHDGDGARVEGEFSGLGDDGSLILRLADGSTRAIHAGEITLG